MTAALHTVFRVFCETIAPARLAREGATLALLRRHDVELLAAVRPWDLEDVAELATAAADHGVRLGLWPMLADEEGRWASVGNAARYVDFARRVIDAAGLDAKGAPRVTELAVDLEPPFERVQRWLALRPRPKDVVDAALAAVRAASALRDGAAHYARLLEELDARGVASSATVVPLVLLDRPRFPAFQAALGTPIDALSWGRVSVMLYTSLFEGWSPRIGKSRLLDRGHAVRLLARASRSARARFGASAGVALGAVGIGALGDEPVYRSADELREDVRVARAAEIRDISLLDLGGVIARAPASQWIEALTQSE